MSASSGAKEILVSQASDEAKVAVRMQRDLKRKKDGLRKLEKKIKSLKADDAAYAAAMEEMRRLEGEVGVLEAGLGDFLVRNKVAGTALPEATPSGENSGRPAVHPASPATEENKTSAGTSSQVAGREKPSEKSSRRGADRVSKIPTESHPEAVPGLDSSGKVDFEELVRNNIKQSICDTMFSLAPSHPYNESALVHYQVAELALMMESMMIVGGNARTFAMIEAFKSLLHSTPVLSGPSLRQANSQDFEQLINVNFEFLRRSRGPSAGMTHAKESLVRRVVALLSRGEKVFLSADGTFSSLRFGKQQVSVGDPEASTNSVNRTEVSLLDGDPREMALNVLNSIEKEMQLSIKSIVEDRSLPHLSSNDTILVFGRSSTVELILLAAANNPRLPVKPKVIVVDSAPLYEGRALAKRLTSSGLNVTYGLITTCCTLMPRCSRIFIGAAAVLQNGDVFSRCGTAVVVASAKQFRKPVLCFTESFKFVPEVWLGNLGQNTKLMEVRESRTSGLRVCSPYLRNPPALLHHNHAEARQGVHCSRGDNSVKTGIGASASGYLYDLTPAAYIDMIICEMGCLHTSAIVAALRDREDRDAYLMSAT